MASTYLTRAMNGNSEYTGTISLWLKRTNLGQHVICSFWEDSSTYQRLQFDSSDRLHWVIYDNGTKYGELISTRRFRDTNGWYHIVSRVDSTQGTASDRVRLYVNGEVITAFDTTSYPTQNRNVKQSAVPYIGTEGTITSARFDGCMSHIHYTDASSYAPTEFGETDATTGEWKIKTSVSATYGAKGFFILKDGNSVTDQSGNSNNFTVANGTLTNTEDNPSNVFCTLNPLYNQTGDQGVVLMNGNTRSYYNPDSSRSSFGTIAVGTGKYYFEAKLEAAGTAPVVGVVDLAWSDINGASGYGYHDNALNFGYNSSGQKTSGGTNTSFGSAVNNNDVVQVAMDLDNSKLYFGVNGTWQNSGDPTSGSTGTGSAFNLASDTLYTSACRMRNGGDWKFNFGNGYFGTSAISSEGTNASGIGKFEYDVPTGYTALSTKGLNE